MKKTSKGKNNLSTLGRANARDPSGAVGRNLGAFLLLELLRLPSYGYDLIRRLADYGFKRANEPGVVYKVLRSLEEAGAIRSKWSPQESGPARRYYQITDNGRELLRRRTYHLKRQLDRIEQLLEDYVKLTGNSLAAEPASEMVEQNQGTAGRRKGGR
jgi:DNA-binding PadR family transcriptional regulator